MTPAAAGQRTGAVSLVGARESNEDAYLLTDHPAGRGTVLAQLAVADGMGGYEGGEVASRLAVDTARDALRGVTVDSETLQQAFMAADEAIREFSRARADGRSMGTTLTFAIVGRQEALVGHVGDSRAWLVHDGRLQQITADHSRVGQLVRSGAITEEEAIGHPEGNVLEQALGTGERAEPDVYRVGIAPGDVLLLTTDGLHGAVGREDIERELQGPWPMQQVCERLGAIALERGSSDNVTVLAWKYPARRRTSTNPGAPPPAARLADPTEVPPPERAATNGNARTTPLRTLLAPPAQPATAAPARRPAAAPRPEPKPSRPPASAPSGSALHQRRWQLLLACVLAGFLVGFILAWVGR